MASTVPDAPREVEIKLAVSAADAAAARLQSAGFGADYERSLEVNEVFDSADKSLLHASSLLRLREFRGQAILTYKGKPEPGLHKIRPELETIVADAGAMRAILKSLGYEVTFRYEKYRTTFSKPGAEGHACLDETPIGNYLELEGTPEWIDRTAERLGFSPADYITFSYGTLYRNYCRDRGMEPSNMVFD